MDDANQTEQRQVVDPDQDFQFRPWRFFVGLMLTPVVGFLVIPIIYNAPNAALIIFGVTALLAGYICSKEIMRSKFSHQSKNTRAILNIVFFWFFTFASCALSVGACTIVVPFSIH